MTHVGVTVSPLVNDDGTSGGVICLFTDLTAVVDLEEQLRLKDTLARLGELTAGLAHEFRNGLATIHGYARLLNPSTLPQPDARYVEGLRAETEALGQVVTNFLNFARPDAAGAGPRGRRPGGRSRRRGVAGRSRTARRPHRGGGHVGRSSRAMSCCCARRSAT